MTFRDHRDFNRVGLLSDPEELEALFSRLSKTDEQARPGLLQAQRLAAALSEAMPTGVLGAMRPTASINGGGLRNHPVSNPQLAQTTERPRMVPSGAAGLKLTTLQMDGLERYEVPEEVVSRAWRLPPGSNPDMSYGNAEYPPMRILPSPLPKKQFREKHLQQPEWFVGEVDDLILDAIRQQENVPGQTQSSAGALGEYGLMPGTAKQYGVKDPLDPAQAREGARAYMNDLLKRYYGNLDRALLAYVAGEGNVDNFIADLPNSVGPVSRAYPDAVKDHLRRFARERGAALPGYAIGEGAWLPNIHRR